MKNTIKIFIMFFIVLAGTIFADDNIGKLIVKVSGLHSSNGYVVCHIFNSKDGYPTKSKKAMKYINDFNLKNKTAEFVFENLPYGDYAFTVHHDENANHKMDKTWMGLPAEGWACSNNAKGSLGLGVPKFDKAKITVNKPTVTSNVKMNY
ncbi:MAG: DUF2141 domain-containing protein [Candidatus Kapabacteria bacterium]|nr:DUF2141 domain-containing protein [Candidatus Kapabacteria bacterium]